MIALGFLFMCILATQLLSTIEENLIKNLFSEGLLIIGWVAMWEPVNTFLYGWWPIVHKLKIYQKIIDMDVSIGIISKQGEKNSRPRFTYDKRL